MSREAAASTSRPRQWAFTGALLVALGETVRGCGFTGPQPCPRRLQLSTRGDAVVQKGAQDGNAASMDNPAFVRPARALLVLVAAVAASMLLTLSSADERSRVLSDAELEAVLDRAYHGHLHVNVDKLEFSENETILDQWVRGFSEGFSLGPLAQEWRARIHPRLSTVLARHPPGGEQHEFWDLGCGTGESLLKAFLTAPEGLALEWVGVERMPDRYHLAVNALDELLQRAGEPDHVGQVLRSKLGLEPAVGGPRGSMESNKTKDGTALAPAKGVEAEANAKCIGRPGGGRICVLQGDIMEIHDFSHARVIFLNINDPYQIVTHQVMGGPLGRSTPPNTALIVSYPLGDSDGQGWQPEVIDFEVEQDWSGREEDRSKWSHSLYRRVAAA